MHGRSLAAVCVSLVLAGAVAAQQSVGITSKDLLAGLSNPARWLTYSGDCCPPWTP